ncbi:MAG TPA: hypothetical protein H9717_05760 [Candidatus Eisenbergiella merdipullorum]|uniref:AlgX/AlgJ SGNH hydrolase-like domain-containing protein n=1 Tax=Candidatus Eisenbergiella merdipullorum TaxID=2838553 RepID=A0A9D2I4H2_9FIRM|nr:hypothetical protein [Candidatus Eisenbergiella merdipullorum]
MTKGKAAAWMICFALMLLGPGAAYYFARPYLNTENTENRQLSEMPSLAFDSLKGFSDSLQAFPAQFNSYFNDHVPFRSQLIELNSILSVDLFDDSASDSVVLGKDDWLFYTGEESIEDYKGTNLYTDEELDLIRDNCLVTKEYLEKRGIEFVILIPSNKEDIYSENLPDYITKRGEMTRAMQVVNCLREAGIRVVYPRQELLEYKDAYDLYWHYDTHWNWLGGYIGAKALLEELGIRIPEVEELTLTQTDFSGYDLAGMMNLKSYYEKTRPADVNYDISGYPTNNMTVLQAIDATELIYQSDAPDERRFFMVRDSFAAALAPVLASNFSYSYMPHWNGCFTQAMIDEQQPDIFVYEVVERRLDILLSFRLSE